VNTNSEATNAIVFRSCLGSFSSILDFILEPKSIQLSFRSRKPRKLKNLEKHRQGQQNQGLASL